MIFLRVEKKYFDFITVNVNLVSNSKVDKETVRKFKKDIDKMVLNKIQNTVKFKNAGIPINVLKLSKCTLTKNRQLVYVFDIKDIK